MTERRQIETDPGRRAASETGLRRELGQEVGAGLGGGLLERGLELFAAVVVAVAVFEHAT